MGEIRVIFQCPSVKIKARPIECLSRVKGFMVWLCPIEDFGDPLPIFTHVEKMEEFGVKANSIP
jgi:hypothetical protein